LWEETDNREGENRKFVGPEQRNEMGIKKKKEGKGNGANVLLGSKLQCIGFGVN